MHKVSFQPAGATIRVAAGKTVLEAATAAGVAIDAVCGGRGTCGKCRVIASGALEAPTHLERRGLAVDDLARGYRLACQAVVRGDVVVTVPEESRVTEVRILSEGGLQEAAHDPWVRRHTLTVPAPSLEEQASDLERLARAWRAAYGVALMTRTVADAFGFVPAAARAVARPRPARAAPDASAPPAPPRR